MPRGTASRSFPSRPRSCDRCWERRHIRNIVLFGLTSLLTDISSEMVYPLVPFFLTAALGTLIGIGLFPASFIAGQLWTLVGPAAAFYFGAGTGFLAAL